MSERTRTITWSDPSPQAQWLRQSEGAEYFRRIAAGELPLPPIMQLIPFRLVEWEPGRTVFEFDPSEGHYNPLGTVHGGVISTLLDSAMGCAVHSRLPAGAVYTTVELNLHFVRPATAETSTLRAEGRIVHGGSRLATAEGRLCDAQGRIYAHGTCSCIISMP